MSLVSRLVQVSKTSRALIAGGDSIYEGWGANQGFVSTSPGALVVDTGFTASASKALLREVRRSGSSPVRIVVNTHDHSDHVFGNSVLEEDSPLVLAHANCRSRLVERGLARLRGYRRFDERLRHDLTGLRVVPPQATYRADFELAIGKTLFRFIHPKGAHTIGDTMVYLPDENVLFAGDVLWVSYHPNLEDANIEGWLETLDAIGRLKVDTLVPGHGPVAGKGCLGQLSRYLREFDSGMKKLAAEGVPKWKLAEALQLRGTEGWSLRPIVARNVEILYESYRASFPSQSQLR